MDTVAIATNIATNTATRHAEQLPRQRDNPLRRADIDSVVSAAAQGDPAATRSLIAMITPIVTRYCRARLGLRDLAYVSADDVAQETCFAVLRALPSYTDRGGSFLFLVHAIASNKVSDAYRLVSRERSDPTPEVPEPAVKENEPERHALNAELGHRLNHLLRQLSPTQRDILILRVVVGLSAGETARTLGLSPASVRTSQHRALSRLRALINRDGEF